MSRDDYSNIQSNYTINPQQSNFTFIKNSMNNFNKPSIDDDEYSNLSYLNQIKTQKDNHKDNSLQSSNTQNKSKKSLTMDFKTKWKTEICHYWEMYGQCQFGDNCAFAHGDTELKQRKLTFNFI